MRLAASLLALGRLDECCVVTLAAVERIDELESRRVTGAVGDLVAGLSPYRRSPQVRAVLAGAKEWLSSRPGTRFS
jgi:hypothetical protein